MSTECSYSYCPRAQSVAGEVTENVSATFVLYCTATRPIVRQHWLNIKLHGSCVSTTQHRVIHSLTNDILIQPFQAGIFLAGLNFDEDRPVILDARYIHGLVSTS